MKRVCFFIVIFVLINASSCTKISFSSQQNNFLENHNTFKNVIAILLEKGADTNFIYSLLSNGKTQFSEKYVKINVTGYLSKTDYSHFYNSSSINSAKEFIVKNREILEQAERQYSVPKEIIASILWIETRFGNFLGTHHIVSVFLSTAMCNEQENIKLNENEIELKFPDDKLKQDSLKIVLKERSERKSNWAINEILALQTMKNRYNIPIGDIYGSWAGAFGIPQFLPSSFVKYAIDGNNDGVVDLFNLSDAIFSVANYLKQHGWNENLSEQRKAIFAYNNSTAYVEAVLKLSEFAK
ncbi:MAG: lytic murein transglycosylase [Ignavibacteria bacterium]|nr:lytic murein transglycosylase [Ignavibacteria bacterium]